MVIEGVMGLFDGVGASSLASTAHVAGLLQAPVVLVVDAASLSASIAALVHGYDDHLRRLLGTGVAGLVLNRVGSPTHEALLREALEPLEIPVLGALWRDPALTIRQRHLGLVPVAEEPVALARSITMLGSAIARALDLDAVVRIARQAPRVRTGELPRAARVSAERVRIGVLGGPAFSFCYPENLERLEEAGAELVVVDPTASKRLPQEIHGLYACGGFPELFAERLADNVPFLRDLRARLAAGLPCWAECGGMLLLVRSLDGRRLCGALPADATLGDRVTVGYRSALVKEANPVAPAGSQLRGHEHHYSKIEPAGDALTLEGRSGTTSGGWASPTMLASYLHLHLGADPTPAERFVATAATRCSRALLQAGQP